MRANPEERFRDVPTAIPAFIGYTEKDDLLLKPTRIESLAQFEALFGGPVLEPDVTVSVIQTTAPSSLTVKAELPESKRSKHVLYYSLQLFYANGGASAFIVSVGTYKTAGIPTLSDLSAGLSALGEIDEPTLIAIPEAQAMDIADFKTLHDASLQQCADRGDRFAIIDAHGGDRPLGDSGTDLVAAIENFRDHGVGTNNVSYGAAYAPYLETALHFAVDETKVEVRRTVDSAPVETRKLASLKDEDNQRYGLATEAIRELPVVLPPSGAIAGMYAKNDHERGIWSSPANVQLHAVINPTIAMSSTEQDKLQRDLRAGRSVNPILRPPGMGTIVWGGRTLDGNDDEWSYIAVRRFFLVLAASLNKVTEHFSLEPNVAGTWAAVRERIGRLLTDYWKVGALQGATAEQAFFVDVSLGMTMTMDDILEGRMIVVIGMALVRPGKFTILSITQPMTPR